MFKIVRLVCVQMPISSLAFCFRHLACALARSNSHPAVDIPAISDGNKYGNACRHMRLTFRSSVLSLADAYPSAIGEDEDKTISCAATFPEQAHDMLMQPELLSSVQYTRAWRKYVDEDPEMRKQSLTSLDVPVQTVVAAIVNNRFEQLWCAKLVTPMLPLSHIVGTMILGEARLNREERAKVCFSDRDSRMS